MREAIGERSIRANFSPPVGGLNCASKPHSINSNQEEKGISS